jgi:predicted MFS family arabinose efflux permease
MISSRQYAIVTAAYWAFTLTDGALRLLVLLHFHELGYTPVQLAFLFLLYEFCGVITNLFGGWLASRTGLRLTLELGLGLQVLSLGLLALLNPLWPVTRSVAYVMGCQALSGIAKDLTKMSAKSAVKVLVPKGDESGLFRWVALLTGSKNALKGVGFFLGGFLLSVLGFRAALVTMAGGIGVVLLFVVTSLPSTIGRPKTKVKFSGVFSHSAAINTLSVARIALFAARDVWFVVSVPVFLGSVLGWTFAEVGTFLALWVIGYGFIQAASPVLLRTVIGDRMSPPFLTAMLGLALSGVPAAIVFGLHAGVWGGFVVPAGLAVFGVVFALNSALHSYLVLAYAESERVSVTVGFYYMANAMGRLLGTLLSGLLYQHAGVIGSLWGSAALSAVAGVNAFFLPRVATETAWSSVKGDE